jgi:hypothetical protein
MKKKSISSSQSMKQTYENDAFQIENDIKTKVNLEKDVNRPDIFGYFRHLPKFQIFVSDSKKANEIKKKTVHVRETWSGKFDFFLSVNTTLFKNFFTKSTKFIFTQGFRICR